MTESPMERLLGAPGSDPKCVEVGHASVHWWPPDRQAGDLCLCGKRAYVPEPVEDDS